MRIEIREKRPSGRSVINEIYNRIKKNEQKASDMRDTFGIIRDELREAMRFTFSSANPSGWTPLNAKYLSWKMKHGYPATIGIMTGALKSAVTDNAVVNIQRQRMTYEMNESIAGRGGKLTGLYGFYFNRRRNIMGWGRKFIREKITMATRNAVMEGWKNVG